MRTRTKKTEDKPAVTAAVPPVDAAAPSADAAPQPSAARPHPLDVLGRVVLLALNAPSHKHLFLAELEWLVLPALQTGQYRLFQRDGMPIAYASWAMVGDEVEARLVSGVFKLKPADWRSGDRLWLIDLIAPPAEQEAVIAELKHNVFADLTVKTVRPRADGGGLAVVEL